MKYGLLKNGEFTYAPNPLNIGGMNIYNPTGETYQSAGYMPVIDTPQPDPEDGGAKYYVSHWEEQNGNIVKVWVETDPPALTQSEKRERAYNTLSVIVWEDKTLTVTEASVLWTYYAAEGNTEKTGALTALIAEAKEQIRTQFPDDANQ